MTTRTRRRCLKELLLLGGAAVVPGCAAILHPERQGNDAGPIDVGALLLDILWFIPGLIPGIVALVVDFGTGAIFLGRCHGRRVCDVGTPHVAIRPGERLTVRAPDPSERPSEALRHDAELRLRLHAPDGTVLDQTHGRFGATRRDDLTVSLGGLPSSAPALGHLELQVRRGSLTTSARHPLQLGLPGPA